ncbi:MAG: hypothetical protein WC144_04245 [Sulfurimonas sp.]|jgi:hypothetical protein|nr:hypothetical protein [Sulfurimonadaceae bacterium]
MIKNGFFFGIIAAAFLLGFMALKQSSPSHKEERIFKEIRVYSPYYLEKITGGLAIIDKRDGRKEKPSSKEVMLRLDELESQWGKEYLVVEGNELIILGENKQSIARIYIENERERAFLQRFYGI